VDRIWCISSLVRDSYLADGVGAEKLELLPLGVDVSRYARPAAAARTARGTLLSVGNGGPEKGVHLLMEALLRMDRSDLDAILNGNVPAYFEPIFEDLRAHLAAKGIGVTLAPGDPRANYWRSSVHVLPSVHESFGLVVLEAMAAGLPVVVSDRVGASQPGGGSGTRRYPLSFVSLRPIRVRGALHVQGNPRPMTYDSEYWDAVSADRASVSQSPFTEALHDKIVVLILDGTVSILDARCGAGSLMTRLSALGKYELHGIDTSETGIKYLQNELGMSAEVGSITDMPQVADGQFDLVICSEVFEHLDDEAVEAAAAELLRVAKRHVIISCPYRESLAYHSVRCHACGADFHICGHIRSVDDAFFQNALSPYSREINITASGKRPLRSAGFSRWLRARSYSIIMNSDVTCVSCSKQIPYRKPGPVLRQLVRAYGVTQRLLARCGLHTAANYVVLASKA
jgi:hypothetical protein